MNQEICHENKLLVKKPLFVSFVFLENTFNILKMLLPTGPGTFPCLELAQRGVRQGAAASMINKLRLTLQEDINKRRSCCWKVPCISIYRIKIMIYIRFFFSFYYFFTSSRICNFLTVSLAHAVLQFTFSGKKTFLKKVYFVMFFKFQTSLDLSQQFRVYFVMI